MHGKQVKNLFILVTILLQVGLGAVVQSTERLNLMQALEQDAENSLADGVAVGNIDAGVQEEMILEDRFHSASSKLGLFEFGYDNARQ